MKKWILTVLRKNNVENGVVKRDFTTFFTSASNDEKIHLIKRAVKEANEDQKKLMEEAKKILSHEVARN